MTFNAGQAMAVDTVERLSMVGSAFRKTGKPVVLVPLGNGVHAGHIALVRAAKMVRGGVVVVALRSTEERDVEALRAEGVDVVFQYTDQTLWPHGRRIAVTPVGDGIEPRDVLTAQLTESVALVGALRPTHVVVGEKDYELMLELTHAINDLHLGARVQGVPTVRMPDGVAMSLRNVDVPESAREAASSLSAALTAGAYAAEAGADKVLETAQSVLAASGVEPEYLELRGRDLGPAPEEGDARLLIAANIGGVRLIDNVGLPLGIGFRNLEEHEAKAELAREAERQGQEQGQQPGDQHA